MTTTSSADLLQDFTRLNDSVYFRESSNAALAPIQTATSPNLILLLSWAGAPLRNVEKYTSRYHQLFPNTLLLLVRTEFEHILRHTPTSQDKALEPAIGIIHEHVRGSDRATGATESRILVHLFSNGGSYKFIEVLKRYRNKTGECMPIDTLIIDSAPGISTLRRSMRALSYALPKPWYLRKPGMLLLFFGLLLIRLYDALARRENLMKVFRRKMNDSTLVDKRAKRCYIYSPEDELVGWKDCQDHAADARRKGWRVREEVFRGSRHVAHARLDDKRYWQVVKTVWQS